MYRWVFYHHIITLLDTVVLPAAIAFSKKVECLSFPDLDELAENPYEKYPKDCDVLNVLKCTTEKMGNDLYCFNPETEESNVVNSINQCAYVIIHSKLIESINNRKLLPKSLWKRYEGMVAEISDDIKGEINKKFTECQQKLIGTVAAINITMEYTFLFQDRYFVFSELNYVLDNSVELKKLVSRIRDALKKVGVSVAIYPATRSVKFYDDEKPIYIYDGENIKEISMVSSVAGELARILKMHMFFIYYMDPDKNDRKEYLADDKAKRAYNEVTNVIKQYLIDKIIKDRFSKFDC